LSAAITFEISVANRFLFTEATGGQLGGRFSTIIATNEADIFKQV
jgi:hypothetical protein